MCVCARTHVHMCICVYCMTITPEEVMDLRRKHGRNRRGREGRNDVKIALLHDILKKQRI